MRRALFVIATASLVTTLFAGGALAKGLTGNAKVEGKGLKKAITFNGDSHEDDGFMAFLGQTGVIGSFDGSSPPDWKDEPPTRDLGPRYTISWDLEQFEGPDVHFVQYLYPYAEDGPLIYAPESTRIMQTDTPTGWFEAPSVLRSHLETRGLPENNPIASAGGAAGTAEATAESSSTLPNVLLIIVITSVLAIGVVAARSRLRPAKAS